MNFLFMTWHDVVPGNEPTFRVLETTAAADEAMRAALDGLCGSAPSQWTVLVGVLA